MQVIPRHKVSGSLLFFLIFIIQIRDLNDLATDQNTFHELSVFKFILHFTILFQFLKNSKVVRKETHKEEKKVEVSIVAMLLIQQTFETLVQIFKMHFCQVDPESNSTKSNHIQIQTLETSSSENICSRHQTSA